MGTLTLMIVERPNQKSLQVWTNGRIENLKSHLIYLQTYALEATISEGYRYTPTYVRYLPTYYATESSKSIWQREGSYNFHQ